MDGLHILLGPLVGAVIGYFTNYLAVKMLFRPLTPKYLFGHRLPFTPGIIPKRKESLGAAIGTMVSKNLLTEDDVSKWLLSEETERAVVDGICDGIFTEFVRNEPVSLVLPVMVGSEKYEEKRAFVSNYVTEKALSGVRKVDFSGIVTSEGTKMVRGMGGMVSMFVSDELLNELGGMIGNAVDHYIEDHGAEIVAPLTEAELDHVTAYTVPELLAKAGFSEEMLREKLRELYRSWIRKNLPVILKQLDISGTIKSKIDAMEPLELEKLVLSVMKKELDAIVWLGAVIGAVLGLLNAIPF